MNITETSHVRKVFKCKMIYKEECIVNVCLASVVVSALDSHAR